MPPGHALRAPSPCAEEEATITVESHDPRRFATPEYVVMYDAIGEVDAAVSTLRGLLPTPGDRVDAARAESVNEAESALLATWVRYLYAYDAVYHR